MIPNLLHLLDETGGETCVCSKTEKGWRVHEFTDQHSTLTRYNGQPDIYLSVNPLYSEMVKERDPYGRGSKKYREQSAYRAAHCEMDIAKPGYPPTREKALEVIAGISLQPSVINWSGGGLHGWWIFDQPIHLQPDNDRAWQYVLDLEARWKQLICTALIERGYVQPKDGKAGIDVGTFDITRVLRLPGSVHGARGNTIDTIGGTGQLVPIHDWMSHLPYLPPPEQRTGVTTDLTKTGMCPKMRQLVGDAFSVFSHNAERHPWFVEWSGRVIRADDQGHKGKDKALSTLALRWAESLTTFGPIEKRRTLDEAEKEARDIIAGGEKLISQTPTPEDQRHCCDVTAETHDADVKREAERERVKQEGKKLASDIMAANDPRLTESITGALFVGETNPKPIKWRIDQLLPDNGRALLVAAQKVGKTTMLVGLISQLTANPMDEHLFLGRFKINPIGGVVALLSYEMPMEVMHEWLTQSGTEPNRTLVFHLKGMANPLASEKGRQLLAQKLKAENAEILIIDTFSRAFIGCGDSENDAAQLNTWCSGIDQIMVDAGLKGVIVSHHANAGGRQARGSTALTAWPDANWYIARADADPDGSGHAARVFHAEGRGGDVETEVLAYDETTRAVTLTGLTYQKWKITVRAEEIWEAVSAWYDTHPVGASQRDVTTAIREAGYTVTTGDVPAFLAQWEREKKVVSHKAPGKRWALWYRQ